MTKENPRSALGQLRALFDAGTSAARTDAELLDRYATGRAESVEAAATAEAAFAAILDRHGPMVWGVCRRILGDIHEAEDAFQATFLVLVRKAGTVRVEGSLGRWLYGVAHRVALRARSESDRRRAGIDRTASEPPDDPAVAAEAAEARAVVAEELDRLPDRYKCPLELCNLLGMSYEQAARQLDWPVATVKSRLARGRARLRRKLVRRGLAPAAAGVIASAAVEARAAVPPDLVRATIRAATIPATGALPAAITNLSEGVLNMMMWEKLRLIAAGAVVALGLTAHAMSQPPAERGTAAPAPKAEALDKSIKPDAAPAPDPRWTRTLPCGASIEVVGISDYPSTPTNWWRPDGSPQPPACDPAPARLSTNLGVIKMVVVRLANIPAGAEHDWWTDSSSAFAGPALRDGKPVNGLGEKAVNLPAEAANFTVHFKVATDPWETIQRHPAGAGGMAMSRRPEADGEDRSLIMSGAIATAKGTAIAVTHCIQDKSVRLVAIDIDGKELVGEMGSGGGVKDFTQFTVEYNQPPQRIREFRFQTRSFEQIEIPGIALHRK